MTSEGREPREVMAATAAAHTRATVPRQPACTQASTPATGSCRTIGTQSAVKMASTTPGAVVTRASVSAIASSRLNAPLPRSASPTIRTPAPWTWRAKTKSRGPGAEGGREPAPVLQDPSRVVADAQAQVQRGVRPGRDPAAAGRDRRVHSGGVQGRPGQQAQRPGRAELGRASRNGAGGERLGVGGHRVRS